MGEFDLSLIVEFRSRPSLYDRNSLQFKDKLFNAQQWQEISNKLGYDVSILKDRMLQLRNRYNLEKRRMEQLREESPGKYHESAWALYESLQFLSEHIKSRRRYKNMIPLPIPKEDSPTNDSGNEYSGLGPDDTGAAMERDDTGVKDDGQPGGGDENSQPFPNGLFTVKVEEAYSEEHDSEAETESLGNGAKNHFADNSNVMTEIHSPNNQYRQQMQRYQQLQLKQQQQHQHQQHQHQPHRQLQQQNVPSPILPTRIIKRSLGAHPNDLEHSTPQRTVEGGGSIKRPYDQLVLPDTDANTTCASATKQIRLSPRENKYNAFGNFISSSLLDLPQRLALELVEKFTSDIVKALTLKVDNMESAAAAAAASANAAAQYNNHRSQNEQ